VFILFNLANIVLSLIVIIPLFFLLKSRKLNSLWHYLAISALISYAINFLLNFISLAGYKSLTISGNQIVLNEAITSEGSICLMKTSSTGAVFGLLVGAAWWFFLVKGKFRNRQSQPKTNC